MIRIRKPNAPAVLITRGSKATEELKNARKGTKHHDFESSIYAHEAVKDALRRAQHDKCAFCESKIAHIGFGDIEHFRPKGAVRQNEEDELEYPGYYWLAYEWNNLFLSCQLCNQKFKRNCFPLRNSKQRIRSHRGNLNRELPLLIDPSGSPDAHLTFNEEMIVAKDNSVLGESTIAVLGLNRDELREYRRKLRRVLIAMRNALAEQSKVANPSIEMQQSILHIQSLLAEAITDTAEYAAMARVTLG
jgi:uncharacterized protein (TIGR02646 family)